MLAIIPILTFLGLATWLYLYPSSLVYRSVRVSLVLAGLIWAAFAIALPELLSPFNAVTLPAFAVAWGLALLATTVAVYRLRHSLPGSISFKIKKYTWWGIVAGLVVVCVLISGLGSPPNTTDAITYHLPRIEHWLQNQNVYFFPTNYLPQVCHAPGYAYLMLTFRVLAGTAQLSFLPQFASYLGTAVLVSLLAQAWGASRSGHAIAGALFIFLPIALTEASGTFNDLHLTFYVVLIVWLGLQACRNPTIGLGFWIGLAAGIALYMKSNAIFFLVPLLGWFIARNWQNRPFWAVLGIALLLAATINGPLWIRNQRGFGHPLGAPPELIATTAQVHPTIGSAYSNTVRWYAAQLTWQGAKPINKLNWAMVHALHAPFGLSEDDPATTFEQLKYSNFNPTNEEYQVPNPLHFLLLLGLLFYTVRHRKWAWLGYLIAANLAVVFMGTMLMWQPWGTRFLITYYALCLPLLGLWLEKWRPRLTAWVLAPVALVALHTALFAPPRRIASTNQGIFNLTDTELLLRYRPGEVGVFTDIADTLLHNKATTVGLMLEYNEVSFPFWHLTRKSSVPPRFFEIQVPERSLKASAPQNISSQIPQWLIVSDSRIQEPWLGQQGYRAVTKSGSLRLYRRSP